MNPGKPIALVAAAVIFGAALALCACSPDGDTPEPFAADRRADDTRLAFEGPLAALPAAAESGAQRDVPGPDETSSAWREGIALFENRDYAEAAGRLETAARGRAEDAYTHYLLGLARLKSGDAAGAEAALARSAELDATRVRTFVNLARARMLRGDPSGAKDAAGAALELDPENVPALHQSGRALAALNLTDAALATLDRAHALDASDGYVANTYGWVLLQAGRAADAIPLLEIAKDGLPSVAYVRNNLGVAYERVGRPEDASVEFMAAVEAGDPEGKAAASLARVSAVLERLASTAPEATAVLESARK
jgi:Flp pilus assembly protein TadD